MKRILVPCLLGLVLIQALAVSAAAMPAFARRYSLTCKTCHAPFPHLKPYGEEFAANGFVIADKETPRYVVDTGDDLLSLLREVPIALRLEGFLTFNNASTGRFQFSSPYVLKFLSGGELFKKVSYYFYFFFGEQGEVAGLEDAFLMFNDLLKTGVDLVVGQFQVSDPLFKRELRLTLEDYQIYGSRPGLSNIDLTYDRGLMLSYGLPTGTDLTVAVLNGSGIGETDGAQNFDSDAYKNLMARASQNLSKQLRLGAFVYLGKERQGDGRNSVWMFGADAAVMSPPFEFNFQFVERHDNNPLFFPDLEGVPDAGIASRGAFAELLYLPKGDDSRWYGVGLVNWISSEEPGLERFSFTAGGGLLLRRNMRLTVEATYYQQSPYGKHVRLTTGLVTAF
jgi:hypothetical protein